MDEIARFMMDTMSVQAGSRAAAHLALHPPAKRAKASDNAAVVDLTATQLPADSMVSSSSGHGWSSSPANWTAADAWMEGQRQELDMLREERDFQSMMAVGITEDEELDLESERLFEEFFEATPPATTPPPAFGKSPPTAPPPSFAKLALVPAVVAPTMPLPTAMPPPTTPPSPATPSLAMPPPTTPTPTFAKPTPASPPPAVVFAPVPGAEKPATYAEPTSKSPSPGKAPPTVVAADAPPTVVGADAPPLAAEEPLTFSKPVTFAKIPPAVVATDAQKRGAEKSEPTTKKGKAKQIASSAASSQGVSDADLAKSGRLAALTLARPELFSKSTPEEISLLGEWYVAHQQVLSELPRSAFPCPLHHHGAKSYTLILSCARVTVRLDTATFYIKPVEPWSAEWGCVLDKANGLTMGWRKFGPAMAWMLVRLCAGEEDGLARQRLGRTA
jgi:hypothetical protein